MRFDDFWVLFPKTPQERASTALVTGLIAAVVLVPVGLIMGGGMGRVMEGSAKKEKRWARNGALGGAAIATLAGVRTYAGNALSPEKRHTMDLDLFPPQFATLQIPSSHVEGQFAGCMGGAL